MRKIAAARPAIAADAESELCRRLAPRVRVYERQRLHNDLRDELDDLREELENLKEEFDRRDG